MLPLVTAQTPRPVWNEHQERDNLSQELQTAVRAFVSKTISQRVTPQNYESLFKYLISKMPLVEESILTERFHECVKVILQQAFVDETKVALLCRELFSRLQFPNITHVRIALTCLRFGSPIVLTIKNIEDYYRQNRTRVSNAITLPPLAPNKGNPMQFLDTAFVASHLFVYLRGEVPDQGREKLKSALNYHLSCCVLSSRFNRMRVERPTALAAIISTTCSFPSGVTSLIVSYQASMQVTEQECPTPNDEALETYWKTEETKSN